MTVTINDYPELILEAVRESGLEVIASRPRLMVAWAEKIIGQKVRSRRMHSSIVLVTDSDGKIALPDDFLQHREVFVNMQKILPITLNKLQTDPTACGFIIEGEEMWSSFRSTSHNLFYYAEFPSIITNSTNWLLEKHPDIYTQLVIARGFSFEKRIDEARTALAFAKSLIEDVNEDELVQSMLNQVVDFSGVDML